MAVKSVWVDEENFIIDLAGHGVGIVYAFPIKELEQGASLSRMMNLKVRETLRVYDGRVSKTELMGLAKEGIVALRGIVEPYFEIRGVGA